MRKGLRFRSISRISFPLSGMDSIQDITRHSSSGHCWFHAENSSTMHPSTKHTCSRELDRSYQHLCSWLWGSLCATSCWIASVLASSCCHLNLVIFTTRLITIPAWLCWFRRSPFSISSDGVKGKVKEHTKKAKTTMEKLRIIITMRQIRSRRKERLSLW